MTQMTQTKLNLKQFNHDIRNPLYIAKTLLETHLEFLDDYSATSPKPSARTKRILEKSVREIDRVLGTLARVHRMEDHANGHSNGTARAPNRAISLKEVLTRVVAALTEQRYLERVLLISSVCSELPAVDADPTDLEEIFYNLIVNAAQAMMEGGQFEIDAFYDPAPNPHIRISFLDNGPGIPEETLPYIFEPFFTSRAGAGGTGFGLHIVKQLVERNGGTITVESPCFRHMQEPRNRMFRGAVKSREGKGTVFVLQFRVSDVR